MRAIVASRFGGPEVLELSEVPDPAPGPGELLIEVAVAGVLGLDVYVRRGEGPDFIDANPPYVPGGAVGGVVTAVGDAVDPGLVGARVVGRAASGGYVERAALAADTAVVVPEGVGLPEATTLLDDGSTAVGVLERTPVRPGEWVLVQPALGGLGSLLVQLVVAAGGTVIAATRGDRKLAMAKEIGAEAAVDYSDPQWTDQVRELTGGAGVQVAFDGLGGDLGAAAAGLVADGGRFSSYGLAGGAPTRVPDAAERGLTVTGMEQLSDFWPHHARLLGEALAAAAAGRVRPVIGNTYPLTEAAAAHQAIEAREFVGKSLLVP